MKDNMNSIQCSRGLETQDILDLVCSLTDDLATLARLARTSRMWFSSAIPKLWGHGTIHLRYILHLIPGALNKAPKSYFIQSGIPTDFSPSIYDRLSLYSPWVTEIISYFEPTSDAPNMVQLSLALESINQFTSTHTLFPRLRRLYVDIDDFIPSKAQPIRIPSLVWLFLTITPSMKQVEISLSFRPEEINSSVDATLLEVLLGLILKVSPEIEALDTKVAPRSLEYFHATALDRSHYRLPPLPKLKSLKIDGELLEYIDFEWVSHLPQLRTLRITGHRLLNIVQYLKIDLHATAFPSLERINLCGGCSLELFGVVWQPRITGRITESKLKWDDLRATDEEVVAMLNTIAANAPMLASFELFPHSPRTPLPMRLLGWLPLRRLEISTVIENEVDFADNLDVIGGMWPKLEVLKLPNVRIGYGKLLSVAHDLPNLRELTISLPEFPPVPGIDIPTHPLIKARPKHPLRLFLWDQEYDEKDFSEEELQNIGLILAMSWPGMDFVGDVDGDEYEREEDLIRRSIIKNSALIFERLSE
ncbi:hypothetical protein RhiJN_00121 [Ceratobasidium sp. AG-Ba]|nr:hypothetical protein RhiJN_00121 [Ceratobasidium sp. AG-Ba]